MSLKYCIKIWNEIYKNEMYNELGEIEMNFIDDNFRNFEIRVTPNDGFHKDKKFIIKLNFLEENNWPKVFVESEYYNKILTNQIKKNIGYGGKEHNGICIKNLRKYVIINGVIMYII
jgi:hypothetical protein